MKALLLIYILGSLTDYWTTAWALARGGTEMNPFMAVLYTERGIEALLWAKIIGIGIVCLSSWMMNSGDKLMTKLWGEPCKIARRLAFASIWIMTLLQWLVVGHNFWEMRIAIALGW